LNSKDEKKILDFLDFYKNGGWDSTVEKFHFAEKQGFHILKAKFYSPIPISTNLKDENFHFKENINFDLNEHKQIELLKNFDKYSSEFRQLVDDGSYTLNNPSFAHHDAPIYYCMIRHFKPKKIVEVGAGRSTIVAGLASQKNGNTSLIAIDPFVSDSLKKEFPKQLKLIEEPVQSTPLSFFKKLEENDILFIDSTHVSKIGSDVNFLILEVLPILNPGVIIHFHDIFLPKQYNLKKITYKLNFWNEQYLLHAFLIGNDNFEVLFGNSYIGTKHNEKLRNFYDTGTQPGGGSFWIRKKR